MNHVIGIDWAGGPRPLLEALRGYTYKGEAMYSIGQIVFGWDLCLDEEWGEGAECANSGGDEGLLT